MARRRIEYTEYYDDINSEQIAPEQLHTVRFAVDGKCYFLDLTENNANEFRGLLHPYIEAAHKDESHTVVEADKLRRKGRRGRGKYRASNPEIPRIRAWAQENGYDVADRGQIPVRVKEAYYAARDGEQ